MRKTVVGALIQDQNKILMFKRPLNKANPGLWEFVGGKVEVGESDKEALIRECLEEIGVLVEVGNLFFELDYDYPEIKIHLKIYHTKILSDEMDLKEHLDAQWIPLNKLDDYQFCPADLPILDYVKENCL